MARTAAAVRKLKSLLPARVRLSPVDTAWLRMDAPGNLMMIVGVDLLEGPCDAPRLKRLLENTLLAYPQFRSRVVMDPSGAWWEEDADFDLDHHLVRIGLPGKGGKAELQKLVATLAGQALDPMRPLWQFHLVENFDGGHALIVRIHHCIADGIALIGVLLSMTTDRPDAPDPDLARPARHEAGEGDWWDPWLKPFTQGTVKALDATGDIASKVLQAYGAVLSDPNLAGEAATEYARVATQVSKDIIGLALMQTDTATSLKGRPGGAKVVAWNEPLPLPDVKAVGKALGCSVNDVLLACAAGAIRGYLLARGDDLEGAELRAMVPVNLRGPGKPKSLGNKFGLVPLLLPVGIEHPVERVLEVHRRMHELKEGYMPVIAMAILGMTGLAPRMVQKQVLDLLASKATAVMTNVPGPQQALYMAGSRMKQMMFWVPQSGDIGMGVSILSYGGAVQFGLITDKKLCRDPQAIIDRFAPEFENLVHAVLLMPWDESAQPQMAERALQATEALASAAGNLARPAAAGETGAAETPLPAAEAAPAARRKPGRGSAGKASVRRVAARAQAADADVAADVAAASSARLDSPPERPAGLRKRRSAFAAARGR
ncbi:MAG: wax ester/triacylglycerol synthase family O-acyltransferase [Burkholderiales bacterium]|nr:wax ester/triacylglycerol synthase family O-acyltransferase [Burkholderiales bacterium]